MRLWISQAVISEAKGLLLQHFKNYPTNHNVASFTNPVAITLQRTFDDHTAHCGKETVRVNGVAYKTGDNFKRFMRDVLKGQAKPSYVTIHKL